MCGISGGFSVGDKPITEEGRAILRNLLYMNMLRGVDASGVAVGDIRDPSKVRVDKEPKPACDAYSRSGWSGLTLSSRWVIAHTRAATIGRGDDAATHPFAEGDLVGVHNGTVHGMRNKFPHLHGANDSQAIYMALAEVEPDKVVPILKELSTGAYALVWYDKRIKALRFVRNKERPLWFYKHHELWLWASEPGMIAASIAREQKDELAYVNIRPWQIRVHTLITIPLDGSEATAEKYVPPKPVPVTTTPARAVRGYSALRNGIYVPVNSGGLTGQEALDYENFWAESIDQWGAGNGNFDADIDIPFESDPNQQNLGFPTKVDEDTPRGNSYPQGRYKLSEDGTVHITAATKKVDLNQEEPWLYIRAVDDVWRSPTWALSFRVNIFKEMRWLFNTPKGGTLGSSQDEFAKSLVSVARQWGNGDGSTAVGFNAQYIDMREDILYGALTIDNDRIVPVHGKISKDLAATIRASKDAQEADTATDAALLQGDLKALVVYCNGELGFELDNLEIIGWEPRSVITDEEEAVGSYMTHPMRSLRAFPDLCDWTPWR